MTMTRRRVGLAGNIQKVQNSRYSVVVSGFDILMRNAIAHKTWVLNHMYRTAEFSDPRSGRDMTATYREVVAKTRELSALVIPLSRLRAMLSVGQLQFLLERLRTQAAGS